MRSLVKMLSGLPTVSLVSGNSHPCHIREHRRGQGGRKKLGQNRRLETKSTSNLQYVYCSGQQRKETPTLISLSPEDP